jgi:iron complex outermembrane receptor protein
VHGAVSRRGRFPALRELYSGALNRFAPNPALKPEGLVALEAGVTTRVGHAELQAVAFHHHLSDAVVRIALPDGRFMRVNRNRLRSTGVELVGSTTIGRIAVGGDLTLQSVDLTDPDAGVTHRPENLPNAFGAVHVGVPLVGGIRAFVEARHTGNQFCIDPGTGLDAELDAGTVLNGELSRIWSLRSGGAGWFGRLDTRLSVENAGDTALYDQCGLPQPGRLLRFQIRVF